MYERFTRRERKKRILLHVLQILQRRHQAGFYQPRRSLLSPVWQQKRGLHPWKGLHEGSPHGHGSRALELGAPWRGAGSLPRAVAQGHPASRNRRVQRSGDAPETLLSLRPTNLSINLPNEADSVGTERKQHYYL